MDDTFDAVLIGAGHNALACAVHLSARGWKVGLFEQAAVPGGAVKSGAYTLPGFCHDWGAMNVSLFAGSAFFKAYGPALMARGLDLAPTAHPFASVFPDGRWLGVSTDLAETQARIAAFSAADSATWARLVAAFPRDVAPVGALLAAPMRKRAIASILWKLWRERGLAGALGFAKPVLAQAIDELVIAYNVNPPSWDPTVGLSAVNPTLQGFYQTVFDQFILQQPDLKPAPGLLTAWGWSDDRKQVWMDVREGVKWHDGSALTAEDVAWSLARVAKPETGSPMQFVWGTLENHRVEGNRVIADVRQFDPTIFKWMYFLTGYVLPKAYYERVGAEGFEAAPIGSGPYMVEKYERNAFVRLKANADYWGGKPEFDTVTIKFVTDAASRVAEVESGNSHVTLEMPYEEYDRLKGKAGLAGVAKPISNIGMIFFNDIEVMTDPNVRKAAVMAVDKQTIIDRLLSGYGVAIDTLETPDYDAFDPGIRTPYDPEGARALLAASGYGPDKPVKFKIQTTRGFKPKDFEMVQAIVGLWRRVGIEAEIEVYEIAKHFELRAADQLAPAAFYTWGNSVGDPTTSTGFAMYGPSPHSVWDGQDVIDMINPLWGEADEAKRIEGWKGVCRHIAENALVLPLLQYVQPHPAWRAGGLSGGAGRGGGPPRWWAPPWACWPGSIAAGSMR